MGHTEGGKAVVAQHLQTLDAVELTGSPNVDDCQCNGRKGGVSVSSTVQGSGPPSPNRAETPVFVRATGAGIEEAVL